MNTQRGITQPVPGQDKEEPDLWQEDDIPSADGGEGNDDAEDPEKGRVKAPQPGKPQHPKS